MKLTGLKSLVAACVAVLAACDGGSLTGVTGEQMELANAQRLWSVNGMDDYGMTVRLTGAWFGGKAVIEVRGGVPVSVKPVEPANGVTAQLWESYDTVEELFGILQRAVEEDAFRIDATFHAQYGVPVEVFVDHRESWVDDEQGFVVETFDPR
ncbi:DUF6174 domain-containing protein [Longimicrobium sp.]|uniref:DUF6174 domain-containing protein n=1 Tax=Longimicrobium sp. TaxID=2029185 RepID=UPI003B3A5B28